MLTLTDNARDVVHDLTAQAGVPEGGGLRIAETSPRSGDFVLAFVPEPEPDDAVVESGDARVFVESSTSVTLANLTLDADPNAQGPGFVLTPQA